MIQPTGLDFIQMRLCAIHHVTPTLQGYAVRFFPQFQQFLVIKRRMETHPVFKHEFIICVAYIVCDKDVDVFVKCAQVIVEVIQQAIYTRTVYLLRQLIV